MGSVNTAMLGVERAALQGDLTRPQQWEEVGKVHQLYIYPVKSLGCVPVNHFTTGPWAPESESLVDRQLMVLDGKGKMVTARKYPHMTLVEPQVISDQLTLKYPGMPEVTVQLPKVSEAGKEVALDVFGEACRGLDLGDEVGEWLSEVILNDSEAGMRLVFHPKGDSTRPDKASNPKIFPMRKAEDKPYYSDVFPYMMMTQPSIDELNGLLDKENVDLNVEEKRFRPNIVVVGDFPGFSEDKWAWVKVGDVVFRHSQVCDRCEFTTVDPEMGDKHPRGEPLKTLRKYRCALDPAEKKTFGSSPFLGVGLGVEEPGEVTVGDKVFIGKSG